MDLIKKKIKDFPQSPGVYLMKSESGKILYVGKAKILKNRVKSYFQNNKTNPKTLILMKQVQNIEYIVTGTELEAFLLEASLIKKHRPKYNIRLKDDKSYPYIKISLYNEFPRIYLSRKVTKDGARYFGPYTSGLSVKQIIYFLNRNFQIRDCKDHFMKSRKRPCLTHQMGRCGAPCVGLISKDEYALGINQAILFLRGKNSKLIKNIEKRMKVAAQEEKFEIAAKYRDTLKAIESILEKQRVILLNEDLDQDVIAYFGDDRGTLIEVLHLRQGRVIGSRSHFLPLLNPNSEQEDAREWLTSFINQYYLENIVPNELILSIDLGKEIHSLLEQVLEERGGHKVKVHFTTSEKGHELISLTEANAKNHFTDYLKKSASKEMGLKEIQNKFHLKNLPKIIECYDISHFSGSETVASRVVFEDGVPQKDLYRRYKIKAHQGSSDDYAAMKEILTRRFKDINSPPPDLILVDGGKGQLSMGLEALNDLNMGHLPIASLAKSRTQGDFKNTQIEFSGERFFLPHRSNPVLFPSHSMAYQILTNLRDEAHRFALNYHRKLRENTTLQGELDSIHGLGEKRKIELLKHFSSVEEIKSASIAQISSLKGFNIKLATSLLEQLNKNISSM